MGSQNPSFLGWGFKKGSNMESPITNKKKKIQIRPAVYLSFFNSSNISSLMGCSKKKHFQ